MKNISVVIPARGGSVGIPNKNMMLINNRPLLTYTIEKALNLNADNIYVSTNDEDIKNYVNNNYRNIIIDDRPDELATSASTMEELISYMLGKYNMDILILLQPTSPQIDAEYIHKGVLDVLRGYDSALSIYRTDENDVLMWDLDTKIPLNYDLKNRGNRQERKDKYAVETGGFYITTKEQFITSNCRIGGTISFIEIPFWQSFEIDEMIDALMIAKLMR